MKEESSTPRFGDQALPENFWHQVTVNQASGCWEWTGPKTPEGYGFPYVKEQGTKVYTHRWAYEALVGPIFDGGHVDHLCRNRPCCNPSHLEPVTCRENLLRSPIAPASVNSRKTHCKRNHEFTPENTYVNRNGSRTCRACKAVRAAERMDSDPEYAARRRAQVAASTRKHRALKGGVSQ